MIILFNNQIYMFIALMFITGTIIGSFLNVCIIRIPKDKSIIFPGSHCPYCNNPIPFYYNIPILSYLILKGKCHACKKYISIQYPIVEILTGFIAAFLAFHFGICMDFIILFLFSAVLIIISFIDIQYQIIPDIISLPGTFLFSMANIFLLGNDIFSVLGGIITGSGILLAISILYYLIKKQIGIGGGDIKLMAMIGGLIGTKGALFSIFIASISGSLIGLLIIIFNNIYNKKTNTMLKIPFAPFLSFSGIIYIFYGQQIINWYIHNFLF